MQRPPSIQRCNWYYFRSVVRIKLVIACRWSFNTRIRGSAIINIDIGIHTSAIILVPLVIVMLHLHRTLVRLATVRERINTNAGIVGAFIIRSEASLSAAFRYRCYISSYILSNRGPMAGEGGWGVFSYIYSEYSRWILHLQCSTRWD